jgi:short-subunit dehydrogenase
MRFADYERVLNVNLLGVIRGVMAFLPYMIKRGKGYIVNTSSQVGIDGGDFSGAEPYPLSKYAVLGFSERLYVYARPKGIMVSVLCPSLVNTRIFSDSPFVDNNKQAPGEKQPAGITFPPGSMLDPDDVAKIVIDHINNRKFFILTPGTEKFVASALKKGRDLQKLEQYFKDNFTEPLID